MNRLIKPYPMKLSPVLKSALWGGTRLSTCWSKGQSGESVAESWELSVRQQEQNVISNGPLSGRTINEALENNPTFLGLSQKDARFPLLIKFIDAEQTLSVQVHPDDDYAARIEHDSGKNEMWYIVEADEGAQIVYGLKPGITAEDFRRAVEENRIREVLNFHPVCAGECYYIPAGLVHAIGGGILIAEIQQNSDLTYRVYDYGRIGADGKPRELHREKACDVSRPMSETEIYEKRYAAAVEGEEECLAHSDYFCVRRRIATPTKPYSGTVGEDRFVHLLCLSGEGVLRTSDEELTLTRGESIFLPAGMGDYTLSGELTWLESCV
jgi:mannose-6-phosphate isomerase